MPQRGRTSPPTRSLSEAESDRVRERLRGLVSGHRTQVAVAAMTGISQQAISSALQGGLVGVQSARRLADFLGVSFENLVAGVGVAEPRLRNLPGYEEAEAEARRLYRRVSETAWDAVGSIRHANPPRVTPDFLGRLAMEWDLVLSGDNEETEEIRQRMKKDGK